MSEDNTASRRLLDSVHALKAFDNDRQVELDQLSHTLREVNMDRLADRIDMIAERYRLAVERVYADHGEMVSERLRETETSTGEVLLALLEGVTEGLKRTKE